MFFSPKNRETKLQTVQQTCVKKLPFALMGHEAAKVEKEECLLGDPNQEWTWKPVGDMKPSGLAIYASGGSSTTRQTGSGQWDHGEWH